jgi:hypothetical protein
MTCIHLQHLYKLCQEHDLKLGGSDLIRLVCRQCGAQEVCPSTLMDEYDLKQLQLVDHSCKSNNEFSARGPARKRSERSQVTAEAVV